MRFDGSTLSNEAESVAVVRNDMNMKASAAALNARAATMSHAILLPGFAVGHLPPRGLHGNG